MNIAIILSGGTGSRMHNNQPKQYVEVGGKPVIWYCLKTFLENPLIDAMVIVRAEEWAEYVSEQIASLRSTGFTICPVYYASPGETRQYSVYNALLTIKENGYQNDDRVIIHDAARPMVSGQLINSCIEACKEAEAVLPVVPVKDTLYRSVDGEHITSLLKRQELFAGQAPEAFALGRYSELHEQLSREELLQINGSTEIAYKGGMKVKLIPGDEMNFKITTPEDLLNFETIISRQQ